MFACSLKICGVLGGCCLFGEGKWGQSGIQLKAMALLTVTCISRSIFLSLSSHLPPPPPVVLTAKNVWFCMPGFGLSKQEASLNLKYFHQPSQWMITAAFLFSNPVHAMEQMCVLLPSRIKGLAAAADCDHLVVTKMSRPVPCSPPR